MFAMHSTLYVIADTYAGWSRLIAVCAVCTSLWLGAPFWCRAGTEGRGESALSQTPLIVSDTHPGLQDPHTAYTWCALQGGVCVSVGEGPLAADVEKRTLIEQMFAQGERPRVLPANKASPTDCLH